MQIEGRNPVLESLKSNSEIKTIFMLDSISIDKKVEEIIEIAKSKKISLIKKPKKYLDKISQTKIHQGVIAIKKNTSTNIKLNEFLESKKDPFLVYIRDSQNEYNIGSIIRSAECAGVDAVILPPKIKMSPQMIRASMGASEHMTIINMNVFEAIKIAKEHLIKVVSIELNGDKYYYEEDLKGPIMLIIGGEDKSISQNIQDKCDKTVKIPLKGKVNSLNMSIALSIVLFEKVGQEAISQPKYASLKNTLNK